MPSYTSITSLFLRAYKIQIGCFIQNSVADLILQDSRSTLLRFSRCIVFLFVQEINKSFTEV